MPSLDENLNRWSTYEWQDGGDEWSVGYGGTQAMWSWTIMPRVAAFLPAEHILEIAPGFGRVTQYLAPACTRMTVVDLTQRCIDACQERFAAHDHITYHVNDGRSLEMVEDDSVDLVFSWDSLIHVEEDVMEGYVHQLGHKLRVGGTGVFHHSNLASYRDENTGELSIVNEHWRAASMSAAKFRGFCRAAGLRCVTQELVPWGGSNFTDCISVFRREPTNFRRTKVVENPRFFVQAQEHLDREIRELGRAYRR